jgi:hypothetical protein
MSQDETEYLEQLFAAYEAEEGPLSDWERGFMKDQFTRWEKYGEAMVLSPKQWGVLRKIGKVLGVAEPGSDEGAF